MRTHASRFPASRPIHLGAISKRRYRQVFVFAIVLETLALLILGQQVMFDADRRGLWLLTWGAGMAAFVAVHQLLVRSSHEIAFPNAAPRNFVAPRRWITLVLLSPLAYFVFWDSRTRAYGADYMRLVGAWVLLMFGVLAIVSWPVTPPKQANLRVWLHAHCRELLFVATITIIGSILRIYNLAGQAWWFSGDEGKFAHTAREVIQGKQHDPFGTTFDSHATMWLFVQGAVMWVFGEDIRGTRTLSALLGTATIPLFYLLIRRSFGVPTAAVATILLTTSHFHLFMSRDAMNNISAPFFLVLTLLLLDWLVQDWNPGKAVLLGLVLGLAQYAYVSNRLLIPIILTILGLILILHKPHALVEWLAAGQALGLLGIGFIVSYLPQAAYFAVHPENFNARLTAVSVFGSGWLEREREITGKGTLPILWRQFEQAVLLPYTTYPSGYYRIDPPFIGWLLVVPAVIGTGIITAYALRRRYLPFAVALWAVTLGLGLTIGSPETNRYAMGALFMPFTAAIGIMTVGTVSRRLAGVPRPIVLAAVGVLLIANAWWNVQVAFEHMPGTNVPLDRNSVAVTQFAKDLHAIGPGYTIYFAAAPQMYYRGSPNLQYLADGDDGIDIDVPWTSASKPPAVTQPTYFFFLPERQEELAIVRGWFPGGVETVKTNENGVELYLLYYVAPPGYPKNDPILQLGAG